MGKLVRVRVPPSALVPFPKSLKTKGFKIAIKIWGDFGAIGKLCGIDIKTPKIKTEKPGIDPAFLSLFSLTFNY